MTAYGRGAASSAMASVVVELSSVNGKHLEVQVTAPPEIARLEVDVRRWITHQLARGRVRAKISYVMNDSDSSVTGLNTTLLMQLHRGWKEAAKQLGASVEAASDLQLYSNQPDLFTSHELEEGVLEELSKLLQTATGKASTSLISMREVEGQFLLEDMCSRCAVIQERLRSIATQAPEASSLYRTRLQERIAEFVQSKEDRDVLAREIAFFADKVDVTEELTRANSHIDQLLAIMNSEESAIGKKLDFLLQELAREANTTLAKSSQTDVSQWAVEIKAEVEKMREQVQNVE